MTDHSTKKRRRPLRVLLPIICIAVFIFAAFYNGLTVSRVSIKSAKLQNPVRAILLTDLHSCLFGENQRELIKKIEAENPDIILLSGDIIDDVLPTIGSEQLFAQIGRHYPCYYVTGNHEFRSEGVGQLKDMVRNAGIIVLEGGSESVTINGETLNICGVDDPVIGRNAFAAQLESAFIGIDPENYTILLSHRPERFEEYAEYQCDLVVSGHAHGGQFRLPFLGGLYAPNQGWFPKLTSGVHELNGTSIVISRGLSRESTGLPRIFNPPEIVVIDLIPE